ncbi:protein PLASTID TRANSCRIPTIONALLY ACTIVE 16, chloroplastic-like [Phoenix dactylifera]|uniref:Protein PLASTID TRANSCRIPTIONALLY ACTIVE 16, chloroplastic-like n=1 Tax=Phoenix dactylifera TaxID=42345 RepID=A0A8B9ARP5_PHODC|nr:protein PLASTID TRANSCRIPTIONALLY ACTIVE 16, chloroplastic-like [Phoenix dactylifera]
MLADHSTGGVEAAQRGGVDVRGGGVHRQGDRPRREGGGDHQPRREGAPAEVTANGALQVVREAQLAGMGHVAGVYDSATGISGPSIYDVLDGITSFFSNLFSRSQPLAPGEFLSKVVETDVTYTLIKARLTEDLRRWRDCRLLHSSLMFKEAQERAEAAGSSLDKPLE